MGLPGFMGLGGWEILMLLAVAVVTVLFKVVRAGTASGARRTQRETEPTREDRQD